MSKDRAFSILFFSLINNILQMADSPGKFAHYLAQQLKSILGIDTVLVVSYDELATQPTLLSVCPDRRKPRYDIPSFYTLLKTKIGSVGSLYLDSNTAAPDEKEFLAGANIDNCLIMPMVSGGKPEGFVVLAQLWESTNMPGIIDALDHISGVCALIVRNARLFNHLEALVEERTAQLEAKNQELEINQHLLKRQNDDYARLNQQLQQINHELSLSEEKYRLLVESINEGVGLVNENEEFFYVNKAACDIFGFAEEELIGHNLSDFMTPDMFEKIRAQTELRRAGEVSVYEVTIRQKNGCLREIIITASPIGGAENFMGTYGIFRDITEQNAARRATEESERKYKAIFQTIPDAVSISALGGAILDVNEGFVQLFGYSREEAIGRPALEVGLWQSVEDRERIIRVFLEEGKLRNFEVQLKRRDGQLIICLASVNTIYLHDQPHLLSVMRDISDRKRMESELLAAKEKAEESDRMKTAFLQNMSHEIRTPMNAIMGFSDLLPSFFENKPKLKQFTKIIHQRSADLLDIINDILDISKIESGQLPVHIEEFLLSPFFADLETFFMGYRKKIQRESVALRFKVPIALAAKTIQTDKGKLKQIFINLLSNAFKFTPAGVVETGCFLLDDGQLVFYVSDTGIGIPVDRQAFVFERFSQVDYQVSRQYGGTGLGLPIVRGLVNLLHGQIWLESAPEQGSTFSFTIDYKMAANPHQSQPDTKVTDPDVNSLQGHVLVVEDDPFNLEFIREVLLTTPLQVFFAETAAEAVEMLRNLPVDLVLLDIRLPDADGYSLAPRFRELKPKVKIIAQTAYASVADREQALASGCDDYISKPLDVTELLVKIREQLKH